MIGLDTNVVIRYLTQDDKKQSAIANQLIESELSESNLGYITLITLVEITWVLESCYDQKKSALVSIIESLLSIKQIMVERTDIAYLALKQYRDGNADFSDALISMTCIDAGCNKIVTFDKKAATVGMQKI
ncbi:MAG: type II toxin-antitoxin system VapC family toxin [Marinagarivorans sp.]|nr:type II toxin-antitoxin system VapC family toxin [Marinagarivorans sp.]